MRFFNYISQTKLFISVLLRRNYNYVTRPLPSKYYSIKTIKQYYYNNNIYYDLYNDFCNCSFNEECIIKYSNYSKYNNLSAGL